MPSSFSFRANSDEGSSIVRKVTAARSAPTRVVYLMSNALSMCWHLRAIGLDMIGPSFTPSTIATSSGSALFTRCLRFSLLAHALRLGARFGATSPCALTSLLSLAQTLRLLRWLEQLLHERGGEIGGDSSFSFPAIF